MPRLLSLIGLVAASALVFTACGSTAPTASEPVVIPLEVSAAQASDEVPLPVDDEPVSEVEPTEAEPTEAEPIETEPAATTTPLPGERTPTGEVLVITPGVPPTGLSRVQEPAVMVAQYCDDAEALRMQWIASPVPEIAATGIGFPEKLLICEDLADVHASLECMPGRSQRLFNAFAESMTSEADRQAILNSRTVFCIEELPDS